MSAPKCKVTDLLPSESILISSDVERDAILQLMEDAGMDWADGEKATKWNPIEVGYEYPFVLFKHPHDIGCIAFRAFGDQINILPILNATDFINTEMENYKGYELFSDAAHYDMICIRKSSSRDFNETKHVSTMEEAKQTVDELIVLTDYMDWYKNKYGGVIMVSEYWINDFVSGS